MMKHTGPYTVTFKFLKPGRDSVWTRKTFKAAENVAQGMFRREALSSVEIANAQGKVQSIYNFERAQ